MRPNINICLKPQEKNGPPQAPTKKQKAASEAKKAGYWSGASTIGVTILYETWKVVGFPGGHKWMDWWNHEAVYGVMVWLATCTFAWVYKSSHKD